MARARQIVPIVAAAAVVALLLQQYSLGRIAEEIARGHAWPLLALAVPLEIVSLLLASSADRLVLEGLKCTPQRCKTLHVRAVTTMLSSLGYWVGGAGYGVWITRRTSANAATTGGILLYLASSELTAVCIVASASTLLSDGLSMVGTGAFCVAATLTSLQLIGPHLPVRPIPMLAPWQQISGQRALAQLLLRSTQVGLYTAATWFAARTFGLALPAWAVAAYVPVVLVVEALPINVAGFGAAQASWLLFTPEHASGPEILAFQFLWQVAGVLVTVCLGLLFWRQYCAGVATAPDETLPASVQ